MEFRARLDFSDITILDSSLYRQGNWWGFPSGASGKEFTCLCRRHEMRIGSLGREDPLETEMATHSSILSWRIPRTKGQCPWGHKESDMTERLNNNKEKRNGLFQKVNQYLGSGKKTDGISKAALDKVAKTQKDKQEETPHQDRRSGELCGILFLNSKSALP